MKIKLKKKKMKVGLRARVKAKVEEGGNKRRMNVEVKNLEKMAFSFSLGMENGRRKKNEMKWVGLLYMCGS